MGALRGAAASGKQPAGSQLGGWVGTRHGTPFRVADDVKSASSRSRLPQLPLPVAVVRLPGTCSERGSMHSVGTETRTAIPLLYCTRATAFIHAATAACAARGAL